MELLDDPDLLRRYVVEHSDTAIGELVRRHVGAVYTIALRRVGGDVHLAQDVAQVVFATLARKARTLTGRATLGGWLFRTTHFAARDVVRAEQRRRAREQEAIAMEETASDTDSPSADWEKLRPILDELLAHLEEADRDAVWLRFFEGRPFAEIGARLRLTENTARMRVKRALDRLQRELARRGVTSSAGALAVALTQQATAVVPSGLAAASTSAALAAGSAVGTGALASLGFLLAMSKIKIAALVVGFSAIAALSFREAQASRELRAEIATLRRATTIADVARTESTPVPQRSEANSAELLRLRERLARLKARPDGVTDAGMKPLGAYINLGRETPTAAFSMQLWARANARWDEFGVLLRCTETGSQKLAIFFASLPETVRIQTGTWQKLLAPMAATWGRHGPPESVQVLGTTDHGIKTMVHAWARYPSGHEGKLDILFQRFEDGWRLPVTDAMVDGIIASLDPATGQKKTK